MRNTMFKNQGQNKTEKNCVSYFKTPVLKYLDSSLRSMEPTEVSTAPPLGVK